MVIKKQKVTFALLIAFLAIFPLGQLVSIRMLISEKHVVLVPIDFIALVITLINFGNLRKYAKKIINPNPLLFTTLFSFLFSIRYFTVTDVLFGSLYLVRVLAYVGMYLGLRSSLKSEEKRHQIAEILISVTVIIAAIGLVQYFVLPDLRDSVALGWDAHWYRLVGSFIDPAFTGIMLVLGYLLSMTYFSMNKNKVYLLLTIPIIIALLLTYSRASYLAFVVGSLVLAAWSDVFTRKLVVVIILIFIIFLPFLPRPAGVGVRLERTETVYKRIENYDQTWDIWKKSPIWGVGFDLICPAKQKILPNAEIGINSCSGADSSLLLILDTIGIVGLLVFVSETHKLVCSIEKKGFGLNFISGGAALVVHSFFTNSLIYPFVLGFMALGLYLVTIRRNLH